MDYKTVEDSGSSWIVLRMRRLDSESGGRKKLDAVNSRTSPAAHGNDAGLALPGEVSPAVARALVPAI